MKPEWKDAPEWANWRVMQKDGEWWWFENEPELFAGVWDSAVGKALFAGAFVPDWKESLEPRPEYDNAQ